VIGIQPYETQNLTGNTFRYKERQKRLPSNWQYYVQRFAAEITCSGTVSSRVFPVKANNCNAKILIKAQKDLPFGECHFLCSHPPVSERSLELCWLWKFF
jgi:hypothetical protein